MNKSFRLVDRVLRGFSFLLRSWGSRRNLIALFTLLVVGGFSLRTPAAPIVYNGPFVGNTVTYGDVVESSLTDPTPMYNAPTLVGDSLVFTPTNLDSSSNGGTADLTDAQLSFPLTAQAGQAIHNLQIAESGTVSLGGTGTAATLAAAVLPYAINILEVDGVGISAITLSEADFPPAVFSPSNGDFNLAADGVLNSQAWNGLAFLDFDQLLIDRGIAFTTGVTSLSFNLDNRLRTVSEADSSAMIAKDSFTVTTNVPEPTTCALALLGFFASMLGLRRSR